MAAPWRETLTGAFMYPPSTSTVDWLVLVEKFALTPRLEVHG
jgi:hypothetical protein